MPLREKLVCTNPGAMCLEGARPGVSGNPRIELTGTDFSDEVLATAVLVTCLRISTSPTRFPLYSLVLPLHPIMSSTRVCPIGVIKPPNNDPGRRNGGRSPGGAFSGASSSPSTDPVARARELFPASAGKNQVPQLLAAVPGLTRKSARTNEGGCVVVRAQSAARHCGLHQAWSATGLTCRAVQIQSCSDTDSTPTCWRRHCRTGVQSAGLEAPQNCAD